MHQTCGGTRSGRADVYGARDAGSGDGGDPVPGIQHHLRHADERSRRARQAGRYRWQRVRAIRRDRGVRRVERHRQRRRRAAGNSESDHDSRPEMQERPGGAQRSGGLPEVGGGSRGRRRRGDEVCGSQELQRGRNHRAHRQSL